jgi:four helix bundle protein
MVKNFRDLVVWQEAMDMAASRYQATENFPKKEQFGLTNQLRSASVSVHSSKSD